MCVCDSNMYMYVYMYNPINMPDYCKYMYIILVVNILVQQLLGSCE